LQEKKELKNSKKRERSPSPPPTTTTTTAIPSAYTEDIAYSKPPAYSSSPSKKLSKSSSKGSIIASTSTDNASLNAARAERFKRERERSYSPSPPRLSKKKRGEGFGTSVSLDKQYLRITGKVKAEETRPEKILMKALSHHKERYKKGEIEYPVFSEQVPSEAWRGAKRARRSSTRRPPLGPFEHPGGATTWGEL